MKELFLFILTAAITFAARAQNDNKIVMGEMDNVYANILKANLPLLTLLLIVYLSVKIRYCPLLNRLFILSKI
jgi:hypothetical protein